MKTPNPFSFKALSPRRHKRFLGYALLGGLFILMVVIIIAFLQKTTKQSLAKATVPQIASGVVKEIKLEAPSTSAAYIDSEPDDEPMTDQLSILAQIYKNQDQKEVPFFQEKAWQKQTAFCVPIKKKPLVAVIIKNAQNLTQLERSYLLKTGIPLGLCFTAPGGASVKKLKDTVKRIELYKGQGLKRLPQSVGVMTPKGRVQLDGPYLRLPAEKTKSYRYFTFPLIQEKRMYHQSPRVLIMLTPRKHRIRNFFDWVQAQKKRVTFIAPSQLATGYCRPKVVVDPHVVEKARARPQ